MSSKNTIFLTNDHNEHCYFDGDNPHETNKGEFKQAITIELSKNNISIDGEDADDLVISIHNVDSELYKIFENLGKIVPKNLK